MGAGRRLIGVCAAVCVLGAAGATTAQAGPPPARNVIPPAVTGIPVQGLTVGHFRGVWILGGDNVYSQRWLRCGLGGDNCVDTGVTTPNYTVGSQDVNSTLRVRVTVTTDSGWGTSTSATSPQSAPVPPPDRRETIVLTTSLSGAEQSETTPGDPDGTGFARLEFRPDAYEVCYNVSFANINANPAMLGHIHKAPRGQTQVAFPMQMESVGGTSPVTGCRPLDPLDMANVLGNPSGWYVQFHNLEYPEGVIRGQLGD